MYYYSKVVFSTILERIKWLVSEMWDHSYDSAEDMDNGWTTWPVRNENSVRKGSSNVQAAEDHSEKC